MTSLKRPVLACLALMAVGGVIGLPFSWYRTFVLEARFGFNRMTFRLFITDMVKSTLLGIALGAPLLALVLWLMQASGSLWWLYAWFAWMARKPHGATRRIRGKHQPERRADLLVRHFHSSTITSYSSSRGTVKVDLPCASFRNSIDCG